MSEEESDAGLTFKRTIDEMIELRNKKKDREKK